MKVHISMRSVSALIATTLLCGSLTALPAHGSASTDELDLLVDRALAYADAAGVEANADVGMPTSVEQEVSVTAPVAEGLPEPLVEGEGEGEATIADDESPVVEPTTPPTEQDVTVSLDVGVDGASVGVLGDGLSRTYQSVHESTDIVVQPTAGGARTLLIVHDAAAPELYDFEVGGDVVDLELNQDGSVTGFDADGSAIMGAAAPWAFDDAGDAIPTEYLVDGTTLTQRIAVGGRVAYPIVADPAWGIVIAAAAKRCAYGALASVPSTVLGKVLWGQKTTRKTYVQNAVVGCLLGPLSGFTWSFLPGRVKQWLVRQVLYFIIYVLR